MEFIYGIKYEYNIDPTAMVLLGTVKYNTVIKTSWEVMPLYATNPTVKNIAHKNHCKC